jgi:hypothetical protein
MKNNADMAYEKTNPNKPNFKPDSELLECPREFSLMVRAGQALYCRKRMTEDRGQGTG